MTGSARRFDLDTPRAVVGMIRPPDVRGILSALIFISLLSITQLRTARDQGNH